MNIKKFEKFENTKDDYILNMKFLKNHSIFENNYNDIVISDVLYRISKIAKEISEIKNVNINTDNDIYQIYNNKIIGMVSFHYDNNNPFFIDDYPENEWVIEVNETEINDYDGEEFVDNDNIRLIPVSKDGSFDELKLRKYLKDNINTKY